MNDADMVTLDQTGGTLRLMIGAAKDIGGSREAYKYYGPSNGHSTYASIILSGYTPILDNTTHDLGWYTIAASLSGGEAGSPVVITAKVTAPEGTSYYGQWSDTGSAAWTGSGMVGIAQYSQWSQAGEFDNFTVDEEVTLFTPPMVSIEADSSTVVEGETITYTVSRAGGDQSQALTVYLEDTLTGTATPSSDYGAIPLSVTISANQSSNTFGVDMVADSAYDPDETLVIGLAEGSDYTYGSSAEATVTIQDASTGPVFIDTELPSEFGEVVAGEYASAVFRVSLYEVDAQNQQTIASSVTSQIYTIDAGVGATITQVTDTLGSTWTIEGSIATLEISGPNAGISFDIAMEVGFSGPGSKEILLNVEAQFESGGVLMSRSSKSSSGGRAVAPHPNPGPVVTPTRIYHIVDAAAVTGNGHSAVIIPNGNGCTYYSYSADGQVTTMNYNNIDDALMMAKAASYTHFQFWNGIDASEATAARNAASAFNGTPYDTLSHNCWNMVYEALRAANTNAEKGNTVPNQNYTRNTYVDNGHGVIP